MIPYKTYVCKKHVESILGTRKNMTERSIQFEYYDPTQCTFSWPLSLWQTYLLWIPSSLCVTFIVVSPAMLFGTSNNPMCHIFLILSYIYISCLNHIFLSYYFLLMSVQSLSDRQWLLSHPTHHHKCHLSMADTPTTEQNNTSHGQSTSPPFWPCCPPAASQFTY